MTEGLLPRGESHGALCQKSRHTFRQPSRSALLTLDARGHPRGIERLHLDASAAVSAWSHAKLSPAHAFETKHARQAAPTGGIHSSVPPVPADGCVAQMSTAEQARWFSEQVQPHEPALRAYLSKRFPSLPDHDDLVQETYARLLRHSDPLRLTHPRAYLFVTARNAAVDFFRRRQSHPNETID